MKECMKRKAFPFAPTGYSPLLFLLPYGSQGEAAGVDFSSRNLFSTNPPGVEFLPGTFSPQNQSETSYFSDFYRMREKPFPTRLLADQLFSSCSHTVRKEELANVALPFPYVWIFLPGTFSPQIPSGMPYLNNLRRTCVSSSRYALHFPGRTSHSSCGIITQDVL